jgi:hypothetical protein
MGEREGAVDASAAAEFHDFAHYRWPGLVRLAYGVTGDRDLAEDLAQTTLANAYLAWTKVRRAGYVGLVLPRAEAVTMITGYAGRREIGYEIPFTRFGFITTPILLKPGQPPLPAPRTYLIASGTLLGSRWKEHLYVGPWGTCVGNAFGGGSCLAIAARDLAGDQLVREVIESFHGNSAGVVVFAVASNVASLRISSSHAPAFTAHCINAAGARVCVAGFVSKAHWTAYAVDGAKLGSGRL